MSVSMYDYTLFDTAKVVKTIALETKPNPKGGLIKWITPKYLYKGESPWKMSFDLPEGTKIFSYNEDKKEASDGGFYLTHQARLGWDVTIPSHKAFVDTLFKAQVAICEIVADIKEVEKKKAKGLSIPFPVLKKEAFAKPDMTLNESMEVLKDSEVPDILWVTKTDDGSIRFVSTYVEFFDFTKMDKKAGNKTEIRFPTSEGKFVSKPWGVLDGNDGILGGGRMTLKKVGLNQRLSWSWQLSYAQVTSLIPSERKKNYGDEKELVTKIKTSDLEELTKRLAAAEAALADHQARNNASAEDPGMDVGEVKVNRAKLASGEKEEKEEKNDMTEAEVHDRDLDVSDE